MNASLSSVVSTLSSILSFVAMALFSLWLLALSRNALSCKILRAILQESEAKLEMKNVKAPSFFVWR